MNNGSGLPTITTLEALLPTLKIWQQKLNPTVSRPRAPRSPWNFAATAPGTTTQNKLTWEAVPNATGYEIQASPTGDFGSAPIISVPTSQGQTVYNHESGASGQLYHYRIRATNGTSKSTWTAPIAITSVTNTKVYDQRSHTSGV